MKIFHICAGWEKWNGAANIARLIMGGASTAGWRSNVEINREDLRALRAHGIWSCLPLIYLKYLFKIWGFVFRRR